MLENSNTTAAKEYFTTDHLGKPRQVLKQNTSVLYTITQSNHFYAFGLQIDELSVTSSTNRLTYNGKEKDIDLGWYHYGTRFYDPAVGRWWVTDQADQFYSPYLFVNNDPINFKDPDGNVALHVNNNNKQVIQNKNMVAKLAELNLEISRVTGLKSSEFEIFITNGERRKTNVRVTPKQEGWASYLVEGVAVSKATGNVIWGSAKNTTHFDHRGGLGIDVYLSDNLDPKQVKEIAHRLGFQGYYKKYSDGHHHFTLELESERFNQVPDDQKTYFDRSLPEGYAPDFSISNENAEIWWYRNQAAIQYEKEQKEMKEYESRSKSMGEIDETDQ